METIKCNSCGAVQEFKTEDSSCAYCGEVVEIQKAAKNYTNAIKGEFGNFLLMAETAEEATNYNESTLYYNKILEKDTTYADAWLGKGNGQIYASKIGDIKMKEALTYWKNAIKFSENKLPMQSRVGKEINNVVQTFFPNLLNHYNEYSGLADSYSELAERFLVLEGGINYAAVICPDSVEIHQTGYDLCDKVISAPGFDADVASKVAAGMAIFNTIAGNKYAAGSSGSDYADANKRKEQIKKFSASIQDLKNKYHAGLVKLGAIEKKPTSKESGSSVKESGSSVKESGSSLVISETDKKNWKKLKNEYLISLFIFCLAMFGWVNDGINDPSQFGLIVVLYLIYYFVRLNSKSKKLFGASFSDVSKSMKKKKKKS
tara:strand:- start:333 stop:1457 length:1125 start_codon:yes stop_codon:yes gene_type:complete